MKKIVSLVLLVALVLTGCTPAARQAAGDTRQITDMLGRSVTIPATVKTIAVAGSAARMMVYADCVDKLIGVTDMDKKNDPGMPYTVVAAQALSACASVGAGGSQDTAYIEELVTLAPDLIFAYKDIEFVQNLTEKTGIPVVALQYDGVFSKNVQDALALVGDIMGTQTHCKQVVDALNAWQTDLDTRTKNIPADHRPTVYAGGVSFKGPHGLEGTYAKYPPFDAIHARNVVDETGASGAQIIELEKVLDWDPAYIFLNPLNLNLVNDAYAVNPGYYNSLRAVQTGNVYPQVSYNYNSTNIEIAIVDAYYAGMILYPEAFADLDFAQKADEIFTTMLGTSFLSQLEQAGMGFTQIKIGEGA